MSKQTFIVLSVFIIYVVWSVITINNLLDNCIK